MKLMETSLIVAGGAAVICAAAFAGVKIHKNYSRKKSVLEKARKEFAEAAPAFSGLYEPLYMMVKGSLKFRPGVIGDWSIRTANLPGAVNFQAMWNSRLSDYSSWDQKQGLSKVNELLSFIIAAGVCRDEAVQITVDSTTYKKYNTSEDEIIEIGNPARVKTPYWFIGDKILEKGVIDQI